MKIFEAESQEKLQEKLEEVAKKGDNYSVSRKKFDSLQISGNQDSISAPMKWLQEATILNRPEIIIPEVDGNLPRSIFYSVKEKGVITGLVWNKAILVRGNGGESDILYPILTFARNRSSEQVALLQSQEIEKARTIFSGLVGEEALVSIDTLRAGSVSPNASTEYGIGFGLRVDSVLAKYNEDRARPKKKGNGIS